MTERKLPSAEEQAELAAIYCIAVADNLHHPKGRIRAATERILHTIREAERLAEQRGREAMREEAEAAVNATDRSEEHQHTSESCSGTCHEADVLAIRALPSEPPK